MARDRIVVEDLRVRAITGVHAWERSQLQELRITCVVGLDLEGAAAHDDLGRSVDYGTLVDDVATHVAEAQRSTIEAVARDVAGICLRSRRASCARVRIEKPGALLRVRTVAVEITRRRSALLRDALLSLGSNEQPERNLSATITALAELGDVLAVSRVVRSPDVHGGVREYCNTAVRLATTLPAAALRRRIKALEHAVGRTADDGAVPVDVDLCLLGAEVVTGDGLRVPHPDVLERPHVAVPLAELAPDFVHPETGQTLDAIARGLGRTLETAPFDVTPASRTE